MKFKKPFMLFVLFLFSIPFIYADGCGIANLATCLPQMLLDFAMWFINAPIQPLLTFTKALLSEPVNTSAFMPLWAVITYVISVFYGLFMLFAGLNFMVSGHSAARRAIAKEWLGNIFIMIILVQGSFYLYSLLIDLSSSLTAGVLNIIDKDFFLLTIDNLPNIFMEFFLYIAYLGVLLLCIVLLAIRYIIVSIGVIFFPLGIFLSFLPPLRGYGNLIINLLMTAVFITFFESLLLLGASLLIGIPLFANMKIVVMIASFLLISIIMVLIAVFAVAKAALSANNSPIHRASKLIHLPDEGK